MSNRTQKDLLESKIFQQLDENNVYIDFPNDIEEINEATPCSYRKDYTNLKILTIDSSDCKDMDDAVSIERIAGGYRLGVHIADVSAYVKSNSTLDDEALERATSIYLPGLTIPMLPEIYTNNLCSLLPGKERNTISVFICFNEQAEITDYEICKAKICSNIKGVYDEINAIFDKSASERILAKYRNMENELDMMLKLAEKLYLKRIENGAKVVNNSKPKINIVDNRIEIKAYQRGKSEQMIEEFMISANYVVSKFMINNGIPAIFRTQKETETFAEYSNILDKHTDLALLSYCHFTSPIRRYSDIMVHRYISYYLDGYSSEEMHEKFEEEQPDYICDIITRRSRRAKNIEKAVLRFCYAQYFIWNSDKRFFGKITGYDKYHNLRIELESLNIAVIGDFAAKKYFGKRISMNINVNECNSLRAYKINMAAA